MCLLQWSRTDVRLSSIIHMGPLRFVSESPDDGWETRRVLFFCFCSESLTGPSASIGVPGGDFGFLYVLDRKGIEGGIHENPITSFQDFLMIAETLVVSLIRLRSI
jgi:hypothetical protein